MTTTAIKERPILFNGEMVRAILDGRKTQTRRVIKPQPPNEITWIELTDEGHYEVTGGGSKRHVFAKYPFRVGQILWVRETHYFDKDIRYPGDVFYRANYSEKDAREAFTDVGSPWRPSIHMPRWASRITLEVADVRVERVQGILDADVRAEGIPDSLVAEWRKWLHPDDAAPHAFGVLWDAINFKRGYGWDKNPWVWVVEFKKVAQGE